MASRLVYWAVVLAILLVAGLVRLLDPTPILRLRHIVFDTYQQLAPRSYDPAAKVRILDVDDESLQRIGQWAWPRTVHADIVTRLKDLGAAVIAYDVIFPERDRLSPSQVFKSWRSAALQPALYESLRNLPDHDQVFAEALAAAPTVLGFIGTAVATDMLPRVARAVPFAGDHPSHFVPGFDGAAVNIEPLEKSASGIASLNWLPENDQVARRVPTVLRVGDQLYPSLFAESLRMMQSRSGSMIVRSTGASGESLFGERAGVTAVRIGAYTLPTDATGQMWLRFTPSDQRRMIPAHALLDGKVDRSAIEGRVILVGTSAAGLFDLRTTALGESVPGVVMHAQAIEQVLRGDFLVRPDYATGAELAFMLITGLVLAYLIFHVGATAGALLGALGVLSVLAASWFAFRDLNWLLDPIYPLIALTLLYVYGTFHVYWGSERDRERVRSAFSHYMSPVLVEQLARDPARLKLGGELREVSLLFCDVRGFTTLSEGLNAEELTRFLNRLLTPLTNTILDNSGTIDKYMGDGIMAFWNAPLDDPAHERNAVRSALEMLADVDRLNAEWASEAESQGLRHKPVRLGIGINTAPCCVGNLGSEQRFDYSVIGDGVNVASRLEGQSKVYGVPILIGEATARAVADMALIEVDYVSVKGKSEAVHVYGVLGDAALQQAPGFVELAAAHRALLEAYRGRRFLEAKAMLPALEALGGERLAHLYALYRERVTDHLRTPPPPDWDGRAIADTK